MLDIGAREGLHEKYRLEGAPWLQESDEARSLGLLEWERRGHEASSFPRASGLDGLRYLRRNYGTQSSYGDRVWRNLTEEEFETVKTPVSRLRRDANDSRIYMHSLSDAYGAGRESQVSQRSFEESEISLEEWTEFLGGLSQRLKVNWHLQHQPLYLKNTYTFTCRWRFIKKRYAMSRP